MGSRTTTIKALPLLFALLAGCGSPYGTRIESYPSDAASQGYRHLPKPVPLPRGETTYDCGPESIAAVLQYWGKPGDVQHLSRLLVDPKLKSTSSNNIAPALRKMGMAASPLPGSVGRIKIEIDAGRPAIILLRLSRSLFHYYVVSGYNDRLGGIVCEERDGSKTLLSYEEIDPMWRESGYVMYSIEPSNAAADYDAAVSYEEVGNHERAIELYRRVLEADPGYHEARLGLGNCLAGLGKLEEAATEYETALKAIPNEPKLLNNLAYVWTMLGRRLQEAEELAGRAVELLRDSVKRLEARVSAAKEETERAARKRDLLDRTLDLADACGTLGQVRSRLEKHDLAIAAWKASLDLLPLDEFDSRAKRHYEIALAFRKLGMPAEARKHLGAAAEIVKDPELKRRIEEALQ